MYAFSDRRVASVDAVGTCATSAQYKEAAIRRNQDAVAAGLLGPVDRGRTYVAIPFPLPLPLIATLLQLRFLDADDRGRANPRT